jgi:hypothetical protein
VSRKMHAWALLLCCRCGWVVLRWGRGCEVAVFLSCTYTSKRSLVLHAQVPWSDTVVSALETEVGPDVRAYLRGTLNIVAHDVSGAGNACFFAALQEMAKGHHDMEWLRGEWCHCLRLCLASLVYCG